MTEKLINKRENRSLCLPGKAEVRVLDEGQQPRIVWYPAVFNELSEEMWGFRERVLPGAFSKTLQEADVRGLLNHDANYVLGRNKTGTLTMGEDERGLRAEVIPPDTQWARDLMVSIKRGDIDQGSFGFYVLRENWTSENGVTIRELVETALMDVSVVTFPAYPDTSGAQVRSALAAIGVDFDAITMAISRSKGGQMLPGDKDLVEQSIRAMQCLIPAPVQEDHPEDSEELKAQARLEILRRQVEIAERMV